MISDDHAQKPHLKRPMLSDSDMISTTISNLMCAGSNMDLVSPWVDLVSPWVDLVSPWRYGFTRTLRRDSDNVTATYEK